MLPTPRIPPAVLWAPHTDSECHYRSKLAWGFYQILGKMQSVYQLGALPEDVQHLLERVSFGISLGFDGLSSLLSCFGLVSPVNILTFWLVAPVLITFIVGVGVLLWAAARQHVEPSWVRHALLTSLRPALLIAFVSYPIVASVAFQAFACEPLADVEMRFLPPDYSLECGPKGEPTDEYRRLTNVALTAIMLYPVGISLTTALLLFFARVPLRAGQSTDFTYAASSPASVAYVKLYALIRGRHAISFLHQEYEPHFFFWELIEQQKKLLLVGFAVFVTPGSMGQLVFGLIVALVFFWLSVECRPYVHPSDDSLAGVFSFSLIFFFCCVLVFKVQILVEAVDDTLSAYFVLLYDVDTVVLSTGMIASLMGGLGVSSMGFLLHLTEAGRKARRAAATEREAARARGRMSYPPTTHWQLQEGNKFCTFLSHYKARASRAPRFPPSAPRPLPPAHPLLFPRPILPPPRSSCRSHASPASPCPLPLPHKRLKPAQTRATCRT